MSEPHDPKGDALEYSGFDQILEFDVEMIVDEEGCKAVMAWAAAKKAAEAEQAAAGATKQNGPDCPAA